MEGKEPRELVYMLRKIGQPPIIKRGKLGKGYGRGKRRAEERLGYLNEVGNLVFAYEVSSHGEYSQFAKWLKLRFSFHSVECRTGDGGPVLHTVAESAA